MKVQSLGWEDPLEKEMATHSSILAWEIQARGGAWWATVCGIVRVSYNLASKPSPPLQSLIEMVCVYSINTNKMLAKPSY